MSKRNKIDWDVVGNDIERELRSGQMSMRKIARKYHCSEAAIRKYKNKHGIVRNLDAKSATEVRNKSVRGEMRTANTSGEATAKQVATGSKGKPKKQASSSKRHKPKNRYDKLKDIVLASKEDSEAVGRPPTYDDAITPMLAFKFCLLGCTNDKLAELLEVSIGAVELWMREKLNFLRAVKEGRDIANANVAKSLYDRACGYEHEEKEYKQTVKLDVKGQPVLDDFGNPVKELTLVKIVKKHSPADVAAVKFWLWNRTKAKPKEEQWSDKQSIDLSSPDGTMTPKIKIGMSAKEASLLYKQLIKSGKDK